MCSNSACLGYLFFLVLIGFAFLIYFLLNYRKKFLAENLLLSAEQVWTDFSKLRLPSHFTKTDLLFGVWQDQTLTRPLLIVKNHQDQKVGQVEFPMASRQFKLTVGTEVFDIDLPATWRRTATLKSQQNDLILAKYVKLNIFSKHQVEIPGYGLLMSERPYLSPSLIFNYRLNSDLVGISKEISVRRQIGRLVVLPSSLPLAIRIFMMVV